MANREKELQRRLTKMHALLREVCAFGRGIAHRELNDEDGYTSTGVEFSRYLSLANDVAGGGDVDENGEDL